MACERRRASGTAALPVTGAGVRSESAGRSGLATPVSGLRGSQLLPVLFSSADDMSVTLRGIQPAVRLDSLWAAFAPVFSDWTIQYGSSSLALNFWPSKVNSEVRFSTALP